MSRLVLGAMTGTSLDGIDVAVAEVFGRGLSLRARLVAHRSAPLGDDLAARLRAAAAQAPLAARDVASLARELGLVYARESAAAVAAHAAAAATAAAPPPRPLSLAALHGQTLFHGPPLSLQLLNPWPAAAALGCDVVCDLRAQDVCAGGQGAPLTPLADWVLFRAPVRRAVVNLGGFANVTLLPAAAVEEGRGGEHSDKGEDEAQLLRQVAGVRGADVCVCNQLLDSCARAVLGEPLDVDGAAAGRGAVDEAALRALAEQLRGGGGGGARASLGTGDELAGWAAAHSASLRAEDLLATAAEAVGACIGAFVRELGADEVVLAGGGARHARLTAALARAAGCAAVQSAALGVPVEAREALCWAVLGALAADGVPVALHAVTGGGETAAPAHLSGSWVLARRPSGQAP